MEGYVVVKLMKVGFCFNNIDFNVCYCMVFVVVGFMCIFGIDEFMGCYDDFEYVDVFVFWGFNMVEMYLVFWMCIIDCCLSYFYVKVNVFLMYYYCFFELVDYGYIFYL